MDLEEYASSKLHSAVRVPTDENMQLLEAIASHMSHMVDTCDQYGATPL